MQVVLAGYPASSAPSQGPLTDSNRPSHSSSPTPANKSGRSQQCSEVQQEQQQGQLQAGAPVTSAGGKLPLDERTWAQLTWLLSRKCGRVDALEVRGNVWFIQSSKQILQRGVGLDLRKGGIIGGLVTWSHLKGSLRHSITSICSNTLTSRLVSVLLMVTSSSSWCKYMCEQRVLSKQQEVHQELHA